MHGTRGHGHHLSAVPSPAAGFEYMTHPWIRYEAYDVRVINNLIYNIQAPGIQVRGGYNVLVAHNTL